MYFELTLKLVDKNGQQLEKEEEHQQSVEFAKPAMLNVVVPLFKLLPPQFFYLRLTNYSVPKKEDPQEDLEEVSEEEDVK